MAWKSPTPARRGTWCRGTWKWHQRRGGARRPGEYQGWRTHQRWRRRQQGGQRRDRQRGRHGGRRGNLISGNGGNGVEITDVGTTGNPVRGNFIGINSRGTAALGNAGGWRAHRGARAALTVGGTAFFTDNVISGNSVDGVDITDAGRRGTRWRGTTSAPMRESTADLGNIQGGVLIRNGATGTTVGVGSPKALSGNVISGNGGDGVEITDAGTTGNQVQGNYIGINSRATVLEIPGMAYSSPLAPPTTHSGQPHELRPQRHLRQRRRRRADHRCRHDGEPGAGNFSAWTPAASPPSATPATACLSPAR